MSRMNEMWKVVLSLSLSGTVMIISIFLLCRVFRETFSRRWQYFIWLVAVARLLVPFSMEINVTGSALAELEGHAGQAVWQQEDFTGGPAESDGQESEAADESALTEKISEDTEEADGSGDGASDLEEQGYKASLSAFRVTDGLLRHAGVLWLAVAALLLIRKITIYQSFVQYARAGGAPAEPELLERFGRIAEEMGIRGTVELWIHPMMSSPLLMGWVRPVVILPSEQLSEKEFRYTVMHELSHYRRRDVCCKWLVQLAVCLHWFNPFVRLLEREMDRTCELACDETVLGMLTAEEKRTYGDTLLGAAGSGSPWVHRAGAVTLHESGKRLKERLEAILTYRKISGWVKALSMALAVGVAGSAAVLGAYAGPKTEETYAEGTDREKNDAETLRFSSGGDDFLLSDRTQVIQRDGVTYILCDGVTEDEVPLAGVVDGRMIMVVHADPAASGILSTSVTLSSDRDEIQTEAEEICREMLEKGTLSEEDADLILETAEELQKNERPLTSGVFEGNFYQSVYYQAPYLFFVGYDLKEEAVTQYAGREITLEDGERLYVSFVDSARDRMEDEAFLEVLGRQFSEFRSRDGSRVSGIRRPIISSVEEVGSDVEDLTAKYYEEDDMGCFSAMISELSADRQKDYLEKAFEQDHAAVLSIVLGLLYEDGHLEEALVNSYAARAYENDDVGFFCILYEYLGVEARREWYEKLKQEDRKYPFYQIVIQEYLNDTEKEDWEDIWYL